MDLSLVVPEKTGNGIRVCRYASHASSVWTDRTEYKRFSSASLSDSDTRVYDIHARNAE